MIKFNNNTINDWNFGDDNIIKVYKHGAVVFYKFDSEQGGYKVCYAVVDDITQYSDREYEDVYDKATEKWYKLNNLNQYEQYGVYGSGRNITYYDGKLTIDDGYEYQWNGSSWVNVGEVSGSSRVPDGYVELTYAQTSKITSSSSNAFTVPIDLQEANNYIYEFTPLNWGDSYYGHILGGNDGSTNFPKFGIFKLDNGWGAETKRFVSAFWNYNLETRSSSPGGNYRVYDNVKSKFTMNLHNYTVGQGADIKVENEGYETVTHTSTTILRSGYSVTSGIYNIDVFSTSNGSSAYIASEQFHNLKVETNEGVAVYDYIPCKRKSDNKVGLYDAVNNAFYSPSAFTLTAGDEVSHTEYPKYYSEQSDPPNNLSFNTMEEADDYAYNNCVYVGLNVAIDGDRYIFSGDSQSGYEWVYSPSRLPVGYTEVEYVENQNRSYLNTQFKPNQDTRIVAKMQCVTSSQYGRYIGAGRYNSRNAIQFDYESNYNGTLHISWGTQSSWSTYSSCVGDYNVHIYDWDKNYFYRDKGEPNEFSATTTYGTFQCTDNLGIFSHIQNGNPSGQYSTEYLFGRMYSFQIYDNGTLVRDLVPCIRDNDNTVGAYDIVNDVFYYPPNYASYPLIAGDPV